MTEIEFSEKFVFAHGDREKVLEGLTPGSEDYYWYRTLNALNIYVEQPTAPHGKALEEALKVYQTKFPSDRYSRTRDLETRVDFIVKSQGVDSDPQKAQEFFKWFQERNHMTFNDTPQYSAKPKPAMYPSTLEVVQEDPAKVSLDRATPEALFYFAENHRVKLPTESERQRFVQKLAHPCYPNIVEILNGCNVQFGHYGIHNKLTRAQLDEYLKLQPTLIDNDQFVERYIAQLACNADMAPEADYPDYLARVWKFVSGLNASMNSRKVSVLFHMLNHQRKQGKYDKALFLEYIKFPQRASWINSKYYDKNKGNKNISFTRVGSLTSPHSNQDDGLVRDYLLHFLKDSPLKEFDAYVRDTLLNEIFVEARLTNGDGKVEDYVPKLVSSVEHLSGRVDLEMALDNREVFGPNDPVSIRAFVKNVPSLTVKVFDLNTTMFYRERMKRIPSDIELDGLVPNHEEVHTYAEAPIRRVLREFKFASLPKRGVFAIELIGGGKSSRALIRRGTLNLTSRLAANGHVLAVFDEDKKQITQDVTLWIQGHLYQPDEGLFYVPFSSSHSTQDVIITHAGFSALASFSQQNENYNLSAQFYVDREQLLSQQKALLIVRASLLLNNTVAIPLKLLEEVKLTLTATDSHGVSSSKDVTDFKLVDNEDATYEFQVPENSASFQFALSAQIKTATTNSKQSLSASHSVQLNSIDTSSQIVSRVLRYTKAGFQVLMLGKSGEPKPDSIVRVSYTQRFSTYTTTATLQTDANGVVHLGDLKGVKVLTLEGNRLDLAQFATMTNTPAALQGEAHKPLFLVRPNDEPLSRAALSLYQVDASTVLMDCFDRVSVEGGFFKFSLPAGNYELVLDSVVTIPVTVVQPISRVDDFVLSANRIIRTPANAPLQLDMACTENHLNIDVINATPSTRVHVFASFFIPEYNWQSLLAQSLPTTTQTMGSPETSDYLSARTLGEEYMYILERKKQGHQQGNMLTRPSLLLNPWALTKTEATSLVAKSGDMYGTNESRIRDTLSMASGRSMGVPLSMLSSYTPNLDFLPQASVVLANLTPDQNGRVSVDLSKLGIGTHVRVFAGNEDFCVGRHLALPSAPVAFKDLRLSTRALSPDKHFTEQKQVSMVYGNANQNQQFVIQDLSTSSLEIYDTVGKVFKLLSTLSGNSTLTAFSFVTNWMSLSDSDKREKYSEFACHELSFFVSRKDPAFFKQVVQPYLANKKEQTFLDHYLLDHDLTPFVQPWEFNRLNIVEKLLLAERLSGPQDQLLRNHVKDVSDLVQLDISDFNKIFDTALKSKSLDTSDDYGIRAATSTATKAPLPSASFMPPKPSNDYGGLPSFQSAPARPQSGPAPPPPSIPKKLMEAKIPARHMLQEERMRDISFEKEKREEKESSHRASSRQYFQQVEKTQEYAENQYYKLPLSSQNQHLVTPNVFWGDYATRNPKQPFLSKNFGVAKKNFTEIMFALALLDVPFSEKVPHNISFKDSAFILETQQPLVIFHKEIKEAPVKVSSLLVSENFFDPADKYSMQNGVQVEKYITQEFLADKVYGCQVVMTNISCARQKIEVLYQIPVGALPLQNGYYTKSKLHQLEPYSTTTFEYFFYFPFAGDFAHFPVHAAQNEKIIAFVQPTKLHVVQTATIVDTTSWVYISQQAPEQELLDFLKKENPGQYSMSQLAWRCKDRKAYDAILQALRARFVFDNRLWSYSVHHADVATFKEWVHFSSFVNSLGPFITTPVFCSSPYNKRTYQHLEYWPLVNERAHTLGKQRKIANSTLASQYHSLLKDLQYKNSLSAEDTIALSYYLLLQDRVEEAGSFFALAQKLRQNSKLPQEMALQYDYMEGYFDFFNPTLSRAKEIVKKHADHPIKRWRMLFAEMKQQIEEIEQGVQGQVVDETSREGRQSNLASTEPSFDFVVENKQIAISYQNVASVTINYFLMDIEFMFSSNPFVSANMGQFLFIKPNLSQDVPLDPKGQVAKVDLPQQFQNQNIVINVTGAGLSQSQPFYSNSMVVQLIQNYGQVKITRKDDEKPLSRVYVKVFSKDTYGKTEFHKDGYTDLRGRFDYASKNTGNISDISKFSVLIVSEKDGACIKEANPPKL